MLPRVAGSLLPTVWQAAGLGARALSTPQVREYASELALRNTGLRAGPGGRSSVSGAVCTVFGANGFVGSYVVNELARRGSQVITPYRCTENGVQHIKQMGDLGQIVMLGEFDIGDPDAVEYAISRSNVVINLIGQRLETMNFNFEDVHVKWPERLASIVARSPQVERFIHFSEVGASPSHPSRRLASKAKGDALVRQIVPSATILKPGPVVGIEDYFYNLLVYQLSFGVVAPIVDEGTARVQPTWVPDVADAVWHALKSEETKGQDYYLVGPETLTIRQVYDLMIETLRLQTDDTIHLPKGIYKTLLKPLDYVRRHTPRLPMDNHMASVDYCEESTRDALAPPGAKGYAELGVKPSKVTDGLPLEPVRHYRKGGYGWGDMAKVARNTPEHIRKYYNLK